MRYKYLPLGKSSNTYGLTIFPDNYWENVPYSILW